MLKALVIGTEQKLPMFDVVATVPKGTAALQAIARYQPDIVIMSSEVAEDLNKALKSRTTVTSSTHQGMQVVAIDQIYYFQAEHKYVVVHHAQGQLLVSEPLNKLEEDFGSEFVRIHRNTLVATRIVQSLVKNDAGKYEIRLQGINKSFPVSRRQLPKVRQALANL